MVLTISRYFPLNVIEGVGKFQDAGVLQNNPVFLGLSEFHAVFPDVPNPQLMINLGTGTVRGNSDEPPEGNLSGTSTPGFGRRLYESFMSQFSGDRVWEDFRRSTKQQSAADRFVRLDIALKHPVGLDQVSAIPQLKETVWADVALSRNLDVACARLIASLFYFELESIPERRNGGFFAAGHILCLRRRFDPALEALLNKLASSSSEFVVNGVAVRGNLKGASFSDYEGNFRKRVVFEVTGEIRIVLRRGGGSEYPISGSPFTVDRLVAAQGLDAYFGSANDRLERRGNRKRSCTDEEGRAKK